MPKAKARVAGGGRVRVRSPHFRRLLVLSGFLFALAAPGAGRQVEWQYPNLADPVDLGEVATPWAVPAVLPGEADCLLAFGAPDGVRVTDGTVAGTRSLGRPWAEDAWPGIPLLHDGRAWFLAGAIAGGRGLYSSDGTEAGTVEAIPPSGTPRLGGDVLLSFNGRLYLAGKPAGASSWTLVSTDGTAEGTRPVRSTDPPAVSPIPFYLMAPVGWPAGDLLFFHGATAATGEEFWRTDGTEEGTFLVRDVRPGPEGSLLPPGYAYPDTDHPLSAGGILFFAADDGASGIEPWRTDGTPEGTYLLADLIPGAASSNPRFLGEAGGDILILGGDGIRKPALWSTDGATGETTLVREFDVWERSDALWPLGRVGEAFCFVVRNGLGLGTFVLWRTDGTTEGTVPVVDLPPPHYSYRYADSLRPLGRTGLSSLRAYQGAMSDIWLTDGTPAGTRRIVGGSAALFFRGTLMSLEVDLAAVRPCALGLSACDVDDDGDGFSTELEVATGSRWWEADSTPLGPEGGGPAVDLGVSEASFRVTGFKLGTDVLRVEGALPVRAGFEPEGASITIDAGGVIRTLSLDRRGRAREGDANFRLRVRRHHGVMLGDSGAGFSFQVRRGSLLPTLADEGVWEPTLTKEEPLSLPVTVLFDGRAFRTRLPMLWTVRTWGEGDAVLDRR